MRVIAPVCSALFIMNLGVGVLGAAISRSDYDFRDLVEVSDGFLGISPSGSIIYLAKDTSVETVLRVSGEEYGRVRSIASDGGFCIAVGENGLILRSLDQGLNWQLILGFSILGDLESVQITNDGTCLAVGSDGGGGFICRSEDFGNSWSKVQFFSSLTESRSENKSVSYFVDSLYGNDLNDGLISSTPFKSLNRIPRPLNDANVYLARGSHWREQLNVGSGVRFIAYGEGAPPLVDASDPADPSDWQVELSATNLYKQNWRLEVGRAVLTDTIQVFENGEPMRWAKSVEACDAEPGTYYENGSKSSLVRTVYIHPSASNDPRFSSDTFEISRRDHALKMGEECSLFGIHLKNNAHNDGSLVAGGNFYAARSILENGTKHIAFTQGHTFIKESLFNHSNNRDAVVNTGQFVVFNSVLNNFEVVFDDVNFRQKVESSRNAYVMTSHSSNGGRNRIIAFDDCSFEGFNLINASLALSNKALGSDGVWFVGSEFLDCDRIWNNSGQKNAAYYLDCVFDRTKSGNGTYTLFTGQKSSFSAPTGSLFVKGSFMDIPDTSVLLGTFDTIDISYNTINGLNTASPRFLAAFDFYDGAGGSGSKLQIEHNIVVGYIKPWRYQYLSTFTGFDEYSVDMNIYRNYADSGRYERSYVELTFDEWQDATGNDLNSDSAQLDRTDFIWRDEIRMPSMWNSPIDSGAAYGREDGSVYEGVESLERSTQLNDLVWEPNARQWFAVGEREFGIRGCVYRSSDGVDWQEVSLPEGIPGLNVVGADAAGNIYAAGRSAVILRSSDGGAFFELIYRGASDDSLSEFGSVGSGDCLFGGVNGLLLEYQNGQFYKRSLLSNKEAVSNIIVDNVHFLVSGEFGRDPMDYLQVKPLSVDLNIRDGGIAMRMKETERGHWYLVESKANLSDQSDWKAIALGIAAGERLNTDLPLVDSEEQFYRVIDFGKVD